MHHPIAAAPLASEAPSEALLQTLLAIAPLGITLMRPLYAEAEAAAIVDFTLVQLNPAARQMLGGLPEHPTESLRTLFPSEQEVGGFAFYRQAFLSGQVAHYQQLYQADGYDGYYQVVAQRQGPLLLVTFTDTNEQPRSAVEQALRESQARERAALAEVEAQRQLLAQTLHQLPAAVAVHEGPAHVLTFYNGLHEELAGRPLTLGKSAAELFPELMGQAFFQVPDQVYATGEPAVLVETPAQLRHPATGEVTQHYFTVRYDPRRDAEGRVIGLLATATSVTEQVEARQQVQTLNQELAARNDALRARNAECQQANAALGEVQQQLRQLNRELEARVQARTQEAKQALAEVERQRRSIVELVAQAPAAMCVVAGPDFTFEAFNPRYAAMFDNRPQLGQSLGELFPEIANHPAFTTLRAAYAEGRTFQQQEVLAQLARPSDGVLENRYFNYTQQPRYDSQGQVSGVFLFAVEVTEQVLARRQVEQLNRELEARVQERTRQVAAAQATAERERAQLQALLAQAPVAIALFQEPEVRVASANERMAALWGRTPAQVWWGARC